MKDLTIHGWLVLKWQYQPKTSKEYISLFKGYINSCFVMLLEDWKQSTDMTQEFNPQDLLTPTKDQY